MAGFGDDFRRKPAAQRWMIAAIALCAVSQFFLYLNDDSVAGLYDTTNPDYYTQLIVFDPGQIGSGWQLHPQAYLLLPILAALVWWDVLAQGRWFLRFGYWLAATMIFASITPAAPFRGAFGALLGLISFGIAIWAAILNRRAVRVMRKTPPAPRQD